jgi:segregation and condensation protein A
MEKVEAVTPSIDPSADFEEDEEGAREKIIAGEALADELLLNLDGFEGPIDILLNLARDQKVDLAKISILALAKQYLLFIDRAQDLKIELAADYLVMAAWLAYLKSRLLVPADDSVEDDGLSGPAMAEALAFQLKRLESIQNAAVDLFAQPLLGRDVFMRGALRAQGSRLDTETHISYKAGLYDLLTAYGAIARRHETSVYEIKKYNLVSTDEAMERLTRMLGKPTGYVSSQNGWVNLRSFLPEQLTDKLRSRSAVASTFTAGLELVKQGQAEIRQDGLFGAIYFRAVEAKEEDNE